MKKRQRRIEKGRVCSKCGSDKTRIDKRRDCLDWRYDQQTKYPICTKCYYKEYYLKNKDKCVKASKEWAINNRERKLQITRKAQKKWLSKHPEYRKIFLSQHPNYYQDYRKANPTKFSLYRKKAYLKCITVNPDYNKINHLLRREKNIEYSKIWYLEHRELSLQRSKSWRLKHPDYMKVYRLGKLLT